ncbi:hypothetical protein RhiirC2_849848 [Rhizophagus irregularis]|nr:hypothetical protein RhiirC2_849848 [Rhizophagus irregularis]
MEGPTWNLDEEAEVWTRNGPIKVILKRLDNSQNINQDFVNQFYLKSYADVINVCKVDRLQIYIRILNESMGVLCWRDIVDMLWAISAGLNFIHERGLIHGGHLLEPKKICSGSRPNIVGGTPTVFTKLMLQCLDADPSNRPTASQLCEYLGNWFIAICDDPDPSELSNQFNVAEAKFANRDNLRFNIIPCHENTIYFSRTLYSIY